MIEQAAAMPDIQRQDVFKSIRDFAQRTGTHTGEVHEPTLAAFQQLNGVVDGEALTLQVLEVRVNAARQEIAQRLFSRITEQDPSPEIFNRDSLPTELLIRWMGAPASDAPQQP